MSDTIDILRRANPVPHAPDLADPDLFDRIRELPGDPRLARPARRRPLLRRPGAVLVIVGAVMVVLSTTAFAVSRWHDAEVVRPPVTKHEYLRAQHRLTLPPGATWPEFHVTPNSVTSRGAGGGQAVLASQIAWECYWVGAIRRGDTAAQQRAHTQLLSLMKHNVVVAPKGAPEGWEPSPLPASPVAIWAPDGGYRWVLAGYAQAAAGHPQRLISSCRANS